MSSFSLETWFKKGSRELKKWIVKIQSSISIIAMLHLSPVHAMIFFTSLTSLQIWFTLWNTHHKLKAFPVIWTSAFSKQWVAKTPQMKSGNAKCLRGPSYLALDCEWSGLFDVFESLQHTDDASVTYPRGPYDVGWFGAGLVHRQQAAQADHLRRCATSWRRTRIEKQQAA